MAVFAGAILLGLSLGLVYDLMRALRRLGGRLWCGALDVLCCAASAAGVFLYAMAGDGEVRLFILIGVLGGAVLFFCLLSRVLRPVWDFWVDLLLLPAGLAGKFFGNVKNFCKKVFPFLRKWFTMAYTKARRPPGRRRGDGEMAARRVCRKKDAGKRRSSRVLLLVLAAAAIFVGVRIRDTRAQLREARTEEAAYEEQLSQLQENNEQLQSDIDRKDDMDLIADIARNELGLVSEGEKVFRVGE